MNQGIKRIIKPFALALLNLGFDPRKVLSYKFYPKFRKDKRSELPILISILSFVELYKNLLELQIKIVKRY